MVNSLKITLRRNSYDVIALTNLSCLIVWPKIVNRIILQWGKSASFPLIRSFRQLNRNSKGSKKRKVPELRRGRDFGIWRAWGDEHFGISEGKGGLKYSCCPW